MWRPRADVLPYHGDQRAVFSDGTIAIVREQDYHVDWIAPDGSMKVDFDGNLWIPPSTSRDARGGVLYDVVNRKGEVIERVQLPAGRAIASFIPGGRVVLRAGEGSKVVLELARVR